MTDSDPSPESNTAIDLSCVIKFHLLIANPIYIIINRVIQATKSIGFTNQFISFGSE
jgi:hypothetical protein